MGMASSKKEMSSKRTERELAADLQGTSDQECQSRFLPTRDSLLSRLKDVAEDESWREFFETYWKLIYRTARRRGLSETEAQDIVQETMVTLVQHISEFQRDRRRGSFKTWLMRLTNSRIVDHVRKKNKAEPLDAGTDFPVEDNFHQDWEREWQSNLLEEAVRRVQATAAPRLFQAFSICQLQGKGARRAARIVKMSMPAVYVAVFKMKRLIQQEIQKLEKAEF
jgi:RNA polymerase sigma factor (sigma-70 family)